MEKYELKNYREAIVDFNKVIELDPKNTKAYLYRGFSKASIKISGVQ
jgi:tetratricopeptide (TPR) repeat protein